MKLQKLIFLITLSFIEIYTLCQIRTAFIESPSDISIIDSCKRSYTIQLENNDSIAYLIYNFSKPEIGWSNEICFNDSFNKTPAFSWVVVYNYKGDIIYKLNNNREFYIFPFFEIDSSDISFIKPFYENSLKDLVVINPNETKNLTVKFNVADLNLMPGKYFIKIGFINSLYFNHLVDNMIIEKDIEKYHAKVFYGCFQSDFFKIEIK